MLMAEKGLSVLGLEVHNRTVNGQVAPDRISVLIGFVGPEKEFQDFADVFEYCVSVLHQPFIAPDLELRVEMNPPGWSFGVDLTSGELVSIWPMFCLPDELGELLRQAFSAGVKGG